MKLKFQLALVAIVVAVLGVGFFFTPHLAVRGMKAAVEAQDAARISDYVDFPAVRESLKATLNAKMAAAVVKQTENNPFAAVAAAMVGAVVNSMIEALVTPESLAMMLKGERPHPTAGEPKRRTSPGADASIDMSYEGFNRFLVTVTKKGTADEPIGFVFTRDGLISWKLSALRLPL